MQNKIENGVAAIIITYNGDEELIANMQALLNQCEKVIIVDNNSTADMNAAFKFAKENKIEIIQNTENLGIAIALNIGVRRVMDLGFKYYLTMDQDSVLMDGAVEKMHAVFDYDKRIGAVFVEGRTKNRSFEYVKHSINRTMTSGNLVSIAAYIKTGGYEDALFIDAVDYDFSFKLLLAGYKLARANGVKIKHKLGKPKDGCFGIKLKNMWSPIRYYYMARNYKFIYRKYFWKFPIASLLIKLGYLKYKVNLLFLKDRKEAKEIKREIKRGKKDYKKLLKEIKKRAYKSESVQICQSNIFPSEPHNS